MVSKMKDLWVVIGKIYLDFVLIEFLIDLCLSHGEKRKRRSISNGTGERDICGLRLSHFFCPPIITIFPIVGQSSDDFHFATLTPVVVLYIW